MAIQTLVLGGGCFWCTESVFTQVRGVIQVESGYCNGHTSQPSYEQVCGGDTGYAEVIKLSFDDAVIALCDILEIFFATHDPTTPNRQGHDVGTQYRSGIYGSTPEQLETARALIAQMTQEALFDRPIVTEVAPLAHYWPAEADHQRYYERHPGQGYCMAVIGPKLAKFRQTYSRFLAC